MHYSEPTQEELKNLNVYIITDNAINICKAVNDSSFTHICRFAHTVNLIVKRGGLEVAGAKSVVGYVRQIAKLLRKSYKAKYALEVCALALYLILILLATV